MEENDVKLEEKANTKEHKKKNGKSKLRMVLVVLFLLIFAGVCYVQLRGSYLEYLELGDKYLDIFNTNLKYRYAIMFSNFIILYIMIYFTNKGIKKGLKPFFEKEKRDVPKLPNKSLALVISAIVSFWVSSSFMQRMMLIINGTSFGNQDPIFGLDIAYYVFQKPVIVMLLLYFIMIFVGLSLYMALYYVIIFNRYFDGIDGSMLKESYFIKKLSRNIMVIIVGIALITIVNTQDVMFGKILTIGDNIEINGAGVTEATIQIVGYIIFAIIMIIFAYRALKFFKEGNTSKVLRNLAVIPGYLVLLFLVMFAFDMLYVHSNELDKEEKYIAENIKNTKIAYNVNIEETNLENSGTITQAEIDSNSKVLNNIPIISKEAVLEDLESNQTSTGYFSYPKADLAKYEIDGKEQLVYLAPREIKNSGRTYNNKTYEYTHGRGEVIADATQGSSTGNVQYIQKDVAGNDEKIKISQPNIYFGLTTKETVATNAKNKQEYDYTDVNGQDQMSTYSGAAGLKLGFWDRLILGISKGDINLAFSDEMTSDSKILINRNIIDRAKKALPYLIYDENPYTVVTNDGKIVWVLDAYTVSSSYPYSEYTTIKHDNITQDINYIRNSVKVIIDSYDGTMKFYITDRNDPIAMAYRNIYKDLFEDLDSQIPEDISKHFVYPTFLYNAQAEILKVYHNVKTDVIYRGDDLWDIAKYNTNTTKTTAKGTYMDPYYTMVKTKKGEQFGLVQMYTPDSKQNIISYLVGTTENGINTLRLYKFSADSNIAGAIQLDKQIEENETINSELETLNITGTKLTKQMIIVPINNTLLYVEPIYQTMLNESDIPILKKVIVASGNKVAIGDNLQTALENLVSQYAVDVEIDNTEDLNSLVDAIIKANQNLTESNKNDDWEMMGKDIKKLQELINSLEKVKEEENKKKAAQNLTNSNITSETSNTILNENTNSNTSSTSNISNNTNSIEEN